VAQEGGRLVKIANVLTADSWGGVDAGSLERGIGGREGALIRLSNEWAKMGHDVTNFVTTKTPTRITFDKGLVDYVPVDMAPTMLSTFPYDACISWETARPFCNPRIADKQKVRLVEMQCAHMVMDDIPASAEFATGICGLSQWHVDFLAHQGIEGPYHILPNGVDLANYPKRIRKRLPKQPRFFYSSSPDRGLWNLLKTWRYVLQVWPDARLDIFYGLKPFLAQHMWSHRRNGQMAVEMANLLNLPGVTDHGKIGQTELAEWQRASDILAYPCDTIAPTETGCITVIEAFAAGCPVVTTDADCLEEEFSGVAAIVPLPFREGTYLDAIYQAMTDKATFVDMQEKGRAFAESRQWKDIAPRWINLFEELSAS
jgi:glycosyltransferase involved in cell wall biosynthesis